MTRANAILLVALLFGVSTGAPAAEPPKAAPLVVGETFSIDSKRLGEKRRLNVYLPPGYAEAPDARFPVLYMPDGSVAEDFLHVAGLVQVSVGNGTMRPFVLVGIENTQRRRDLTAPTEAAEDKKIAAKVGGSEGFRAFVRDELMPEVKARYRTTKEAAIVGESLAGLFVVETFLLEPDLFDRLRPEPVVEQRQARRGRGHEAPRHTRQHRTCHDRRGTVQAQDQAGRTVHRARRAVHRSGPEDDRPVRAAGHEHPHPAALPYSSYRRHHEYGPPALKSSG